MKYWLACLALVFLALAACDIAKPHLPQWDVDLTVPLMNERFFVSDLADSVNLIVGDDQVLTLINSGQAETPIFGHVNFNPGIEVNNLTLLSGIDLDLTLPLQDPTGSVFLSFGEFTQGYLQYLFDVDDAADVQVTLSLPDVQDPNGTPLALVFNGSENWQSYDLPGCHIGIEDSGLIQDSLRFVFNVQSNQPDGTPVGTAALRLNTQIGFRIFQGYLYDYVRALEGTVSTIEIEYPFDIEEAIALNQASVMLEVTNEVGFGAEFHGSIRATNTRSGEIRIIPVVDEDGNFFHVDPATLTGSTVTELNFTNNISQILQIMPDTVEIFDSYLLINGGANGVPGFVEEHDKLYCDYTINAPFVFEFFDHTFELSDVTEVNISEDTRDLIADRVLGANLTVGAVNKVPVGAVATMYVGTTPEVDPGDPASYAFSKTVTLHSSQYSGPDVNQDGEQIIQLGLTEEELNLFENPLLYLRWTFSFEPSNGPVTIYASSADYIQLKAMLSAKVLVDGEE